SDVMQCVLSASRDITARDAPRSVRDVRKRVLKFLPLARACGAAEVFAIDIDPAKLETAEAYGARSIDPALGAPGAADPRSCARPRRRHGAGVRRHTRDAGASGGIACRAELPDTHQPAGRDCPSLRSSALDADQINSRLDALAGFRGRTRSVIVMSDAR